MARLGMVIDTRRCVGCMDCVVACKTENQTPEGMNRDWIAYATKGRFPSLSMTIRSERCNHCDDAALRDLLPDRGEPRPRVGRHRPRHRRRSASAARPASPRCPYDARYVHPDGYADKCTFCIHRVEKGQDPACVSVCPTHCMHFGDLDDPESEVSRLLASRRHHAVLPEAGTRPRIFFLE